VLATCGNIAETGDGDKNRCAGQLKERLACSQSKNITITNVTELAASPNVLLKKLKMLKVTLLNAQSG
jgi:hypothetical protein